MYIAGAPECYNHSDFGRFKATLVTTKVDVWSLGCVFLLGCTWIAKGPQGILDFADRRRKAIGNLSYRMADEDCFHDGSQPLDAVVDWLRLLRQDLNPEDFITGRVLDMIKVMLHRSPDKRHDAESLQASAEMMLESARHSLHDSRITTTIRDSIMVDSPTSPGVNPVKAYHSPSLPAVLSNSHERRTSTSRSLALDTNGHGPPVRSSESTLDTSVPSSPQRSVTTPQMHHARTFSRPNTGQGSNISQLRDSSAPEPPTMAPQSGVPARMEYAEALEWYKRMKSKASMKMDKLRDHYLTRWLEGRDHVGVSVSLLDLPLTSQGAGHRQFRVYAGVEGLTVCCSRPS